MIFFFLLIATKNLSIFSKNQIMFELDGVVNSETDLLKEFGRG